MTDPYAFTVGEIQQLLGRALRARVEPHDRRAFTGRRVLVTGAAGSIGSELARELAASDPAIVGVLDQSELGLFTIERELQARYPGVTVVPVLADVTRGSAMRRAVRRIRPDVVYHAAAYKHVTMAERAPASAACVNVIGTAEAAAAAASVGARFVLISSDKAADPTSVMGATKRLAERVSLAMASSTFRPVVVRFGNVIGSSGSVLRIMREQIRRGLPIPLTDAGATRYFMTVGEAVALVLRADLLGQAADIFWLEMGRPMRMRDLTSRLLDLEAAAGFPAVPIEIIGLRPGEKRNEVLADRRLSFRRTIDRRIRVAHEPASDAADAANILARLRRATARADDGAVLRVLAEAVPGFEPSAQALAAADPSTPAAPALRAGRSRHAA
jgi:FlaA1/EpsC-like NDP-sugar epimerase